MVSVWLPSDGLLQQLPSYLGFSYLGCGVTLHGCSSKVQALLLTLDKVAPPDLECGVAPLGPPAPGQHEFHILGWPGRSFMCSCNSLKNPNKLFGQPNTYAQCVCFFEFLSRLWCGRDQAQPLYKYVLSLEGLPHPSAALTFHTQPRHWLFGDFEPSPAPGKFFTMTLSVLTVHCSFSEHSVWSTMSCWSAGFRPFRVR